MLENATSIALSHSRLHLIRYSLPPPKGLAHGVIGLWIALLLFVPVGSYGGESPVVDPCGSAVTTAQMRRCLGEQYEKADGELNRVYRRLMAQLSESRQSKLQTAQRAWITFRDQSAVFEASAVEGGTLYPVIHLATLISMTRERAKALAALAAESGSR